MVLRWHPPRAYRRQKTYLVVCACALTLVLFLLWKWGHGEPEPGPVHWNVNVSSRKPDEVHHILFVKVHKAASSTVTSLFIRFSIARQLNVMFPTAKHNILSERWRWPLAQLAEHPPSPPFLFDILCNHVVYDPRVETFLHRDSVHVAILREPLSQVFSAFNYYRTDYIEDYLKKPSDFHDFVSKQDQYETKELHRSFTNNRQAVDLGLPALQIRNSSHVAAFVKEIDHLFHLVLIAEKFDESMVLLRRYLKWTMKDILYVSLNKRAKRTPPKLDPIVERKFRRFDQFDIALYDHFSKKFDQLVREGGQDFADEVQAYKAILEQVHRFCDMELPAAQGPLRVPQQKWNDRFELQRSECETITLQEMQLDERAMLMQQKRLQVGN